MLLYPVEMMPDDDTIMLRVVDLPGCVTYGSDEVEALKWGVDAARTMVRALVRDREDVPLPSPADGRPTIRLPILDELKLRLYLAMRAGDVTQVDLARRLNVSPKEVRRLLDLGHASRLDLVETALRALGYQAEVTVRRTTDAAA